MTDRATSAATSNPPSISAPELHQILLDAHTRGNAARLRFIEVLGAVDRQRAYLELGFPDVVSYASATFGHGRSQIYDFLRVARALEGLPLIRESFERGKLSWTLTAAMTRVATAESEAEWIELARENSVARVIAEARDAARRKRTRPRKDPHGLPGLSRKLSFEFTAHDHAIVEQALARVAGEMERSLGGERPEPADVLLQIMRRILSEGITENGGGSPYRVVYHQCPDCHRATVETATGRVEVPSEVIERVAGDASVVAIAPEDEVPDSAEGTSPTRSRRLPAELRDHPNSPALRRELIARSGGRCENPSCRRHVGACGHGHHIEHRACGGRTALWNEVYLCGTCHALVHAGLLLVEGDPSGGLRWRTRSMEILAPVEEELPAAAEPSDVTGPRRGEGAGAQRGGGRVQIPGQPAPAGGGGLFLRSSRREGERRWRRSPGSGR